MLVFFRADRLGNILPFIFYLAPQTNVPNSNLLSVWATLKMGSPIQPVPNFWTQLLL